MNPNQKNQIRTLADSVLERPVHEREAFLVARCGDDEALIEEVRDELRERERSMSMHPELAGSDARTVTDVIGRVVDPFIGEVIDGYRIDSRLGAGGMGVVYKVENVSLKRIEALKVISPRLVDNPEVRKKFLGEAHALAKIHHPNIVTIFNLRQSRLGHYITMEYAEGQNLAERLGEVGVMEWKEAIPFLKQLLAALDYAHNQGIIHRDIKPNNVMVTSDDVVKVLDFGLAKFFMESAMTTLVSGTLYYMSPEQIDGRDLGPRSDLFSVGMTAYEMLSGKLPFNRKDSEYSIYRAIKEDPFPALTSMEDRVPEALSDIVMKALEKDPDDRFESARAMIEALDAFVAEQEAPERGTIAETEPLPGLPPSESVNWRVWGSVGAVIAVVLLFVVYVLTGGRSAGGLGGGSFATVSITSIPEGALILFNGRDVGETPLDRYEVPVPSDSVRLELRKAGFHTVDTVLSIPQEGRLSLNVPLEESASVIDSVAVVSVVSRPAGAAVWMDGERIGTTPLDNLSTEPGDHALRFELAGYRPLTQSVNLGGGMAENVNVLLEPITIPDEQSGEQTGGQTDGQPNAATGRLSVQAVAEGSVFVDDEPIEAGSSVELSAGQHVVRCGEMPWHAEQIVDVAEDASQNVTCHFERTIVVRAAGPGGAVLDANVLLGGEPAGTTGAEFVRGPGSVAVAAELEGYASAEGTQQISIRPSFDPPDPLEVTFTLVPEAPASAPAALVGSAARDIADRLETAIRDDTWDDLPQPVVDFYRNRLNEDRRTYDILNPRVFLELDRAAVDGAGGSLPVTVNYDLMQRGRNQSFSDRITSTWTWQIEGDQATLQTVLEDG